jgi:hypothetical protein
MYDGGAADDVPEDSTRFLLKIPVILILMEFGIK